MGRSYLTTTAASKVNLLFNSLLGSRRHYGYITILSVSVVTGTRLLSIYLLLPTKWQQWYWSISTAVGGYENTRRGVFRRRRLFCYYSCHNQGDGADCPPVPTALQSKKACIFLPNKTAKGGNESCRSISIEILTYLWGHPQMLNILDVTWNDTVMAFLTEHRTRRDK